MMVAEGTVGLVGLATLLIALSSMQSADVTSAAVRAVADEEFRAMEDGDIDRFLNLLTGDSLFFPPNDSPKGGDRIRPWIAEFMQGFKVRFDSYRHEDVFLSAEWAILRTSFQWTVTPQNAGDGLVTLGNTFRVFRRDPKGPWKLAREIWTTYAQPTQN